MEDTLGENGETFLNDNQYHVLILIIMEDTLGGLQSMLNAIKAKGS